MFDGSMQDLPELGMALTHFGREGMWWIHLNSMDVQVCLCRYMVICCSPERNNI